MTDTNEFIIWERYTEDADGNEVEEEVKIPAKFEVCDTCRGKGTHVHPDIDGHGISEEEWNGPDWGPEEQEAYMSGRYDVICRECKGERVTKVVDWDRLKDTNPKLAEDYGDYLDDEADYHRMCRMEREMGA
jgi:hypothetical protein